MRSLFLVCAFIGLAVAAVDFQLLAEHEVMDNYAFSFKVALKPQNMDTLESLFWEVNNPKSPFYGEFLDNEQIADLISMSEENIQKVESFLTAKSGEFCNVYTTRGIHRDYIFVDTCAAQAQVIFPNLRLNVYQAEEHKVLRSAITMDIKENSHLLGVPADLHELIHSIQDVTDLPVISNARQFDPSTPWLSTDKELTVQDMITYFGITYDEITAATLAADDGQVRASVVEFSGGAFSASELKSFQSKYDIPNNPIRKVFGTEETFEESVEASLDVQTITAIAQNVQVWDFVFGSNFDFVPVVEKLMSTSGAPKVMSASYGEPETVFGESKVETNNTAFMKLGLAGFTFLAAAGDVGPVLNPDSCKHFDAEYPSSSPYIISVGGTALNASTGVEGVWVHGSGGFSVYNKRPAYQNDAVENYLNTASLPSNPAGAVYNTANRAYPDVSAFGAYEPVLADGSYQPVGGTSGACPQFAGIIAMINAYRYQNGLGPLGALNQTLYGLENGVGRDVVTGMNYATSRFGCYGQYLPGFKAVAGWDAATGLGSPKWETLLSQLGSIKGTDGGHKRHHKKHHKREFLPVD